MGLFGRLIRVVEMKISRLIKLVNRIDDPGEALDYSYRRQLELGRKIRSSIAGVIVARKRLEVQRDLLEYRIARLWRNACDAVVDMREDLAEAALRNKVQVEGDLKLLDGEIELLHAEQNRLTDMARMIRARIELFCVQKESIKARYTAARAGMDIRDAMAGLYQEMGSVSSTMVASDLTWQLWARSEALDEMACCGSFDVLPWQGGVSECRLYRMQGNEAVNSDLERLRSEIWHRNRCGDRDARPPPG
jgi:Phage shock protein A (IM30), suppresses sigma54-dependent transcription